MLKNLLTWAIAHPESALLYATLILSIPGVVYAAVKTAVQKVTGRPAKGGAWTVMDVVVETLPNIPGAINRLVRAGGAPSIFAPPARDTVAPPPSDPQRGAVRVGALLVICGAVVVASMVGAVLTGCREPSNCNRQTDSWRCSPTGRPERCSEGNVWRSYAYGPCSLTGEVCVSVPGAAFCRPPRDASLPANPFTDASTQE